MRSPRRCSRSTRRTARAIRRAVPGAALALGAVASAPPARAADIASDGALVFDPGALAKYGFESFGDLHEAGASIIAGSSGLYATSPLTSDELAKMLTDDALEGRHAIVLRHDLGLGIALRDEALFARCADKRIAVTFWGRSFGAEPVLEVVYAHNTTNVGPGRIHVTAIRTGRETSDGWVEYGTGPVDGSVSGMLLRAIVLTARYATTQGASTLLGGDLVGVASSPAILLEPTAYAVADAVEVREAEGRAMPASRCTPATVDAACGASGECELGHCVDGAAVWGPVPEAEDHRRDLVARWAFLAQSLHADRKATAIAAATFPGADTRLASITTPRAFYGDLHELVTGLRDSHTQLGGPPSWDSALYPIADAWSGALDVCFGLAEDDLAAGGPVYAVFASGTRPSIDDSIEPGDVLTAIDGVAPDEWLRGLVPRFAPSLPNDPAADPTFTALVLEPIARHATTITLSRCKTGGGCEALPEIRVAARLFDLVSSGGVTKGYSRLCSPRFDASVRDPPPDGASTDAVVVQVDGGVATVQFDGFVGTYTEASGWHPWEDPWTHAFAGNTKLVIDARLGHGGKFSLGRFLFRLMRGSAEPYGAFAMPRGAFDDPDPPWLFAPSWDACGAGDVSPDACHWAGGQTMFTDSASPPGCMAKIAWLHGDDVSMNDIVPRLMAGRSNFRVFGPHPSRGAYGEVSRLPAILPSWRAGGLQVLDMRFGATPAAARAAPWESGKGVAPDVVVLEKVSDILKKRDTVLEAARAWVSQ